MTAAPSVVRAAAVSMWTLAPFGLAVTVVNALAVRRTLERFPAMPSPPRGLTYAEALRYLQVYGWGRTLLIAALFAVATLAYGLLARAVLRGGHRRPGALTVPAGALAGCFALACLWTYANPVVAFRHHAKGEPAIALLDLNGFGLPAATPGWFRPTIAALLIAAVTAQVAALLLVTRSRAVAWAAGAPPGPGRARHGPDRDSRRAGLLLLVPLCVLGLYAAINTVAARVSWAGLLASGYQRSTPADRPVEAVDSLTLLATVGTLVWALPTIVYGLVLLSRRRPRNGGAGLALAAAASIPYLLVLLYFTPNNPMSHHLYADDQSGLIDNRPGWHDPALYLLLGVAVLAQAAALTLMARRRQTQGGARL